MKSQYIKEKQEQAVLAKVGEAGVTESPAPPALLAETLILSSEITDPNQANPVYAAKIKHKTYRPTIQAPMKVL